MLEVDFSPMNELLDQKLTRRQTFALSTMWGLRKPVEVVERLVTSNEGRELGLIQQEISARLKRVQFLRETEQFSFPEGDDFVKRTQINSLLPIERVPLTLQVKPPEVPNFGAIDEIQSALRIVDPFERMKLIVSMLGVETREKWGYTEYDQIVERFNTARGRKNFMSAFNWQARDWLDIDVSKVAWKYHDDDMRNIVDSVNKGEEIRIPNKNITMILRTEEQLPYGTPFPHEMYAYIYGGRYADTERAWAHSRRMLDRWWNEDDAMVGQMLEAQELFSERHRIGNPRYQLKDQFSCNTYVMDVVNALGHGKMFVPYKIGDTATMRNFFTHKGDSLGWSQPHSREEYNDMLKKGYYFVGVYSDGISGHSWVLFPMVDNGEVVSVVSQASFQIAWQRLSDGDSKASLGDIWGRPIV